MPPVAFVRSSDEAFEKKKKYKSRKNFTTRKSVAQGYTYAKVTKE